MGGGGGEGRRGVRQDQRDDRRKKKIPDQGHDVGRAARINACATVILCPPSISLLPSLLSFTGVRMEGAATAASALYP